MTTTQYKLWNALADGQPHPASQLCELLNDSLAAGALKVHICQLRKLLPAGQDISCERVRGESRYRIVRLLHRG